MKQIIHTNNAPAAIGAYSQAVRAGNTVWLSGQIPLVPETGELVSGDFAAQATQVFKNLQAVITAAGGTFDNVVKINAYLTDLANFATFNEVQAKFMQQPFPARAAVGVASLPKGALVEAEAILVLD
ncbi:MAG: RidA family protein [Neisseriaceae bacterium]|nr:RidA family protein [Neisseriaceae bacterium]